MRNFTATCVVIVAGLAACTSEPVGELVSTVVIPPGVNCPNGGQAIQTGLDSNGNGVLDAGEVASTSYVCAGEHDLVVVVAEPPGSNCPDGGQAIETGEDKNGDGMLEASEITSTTYACNTTPARMTTLSGDVLVRNSDDAAALVGVTEIDGNLEIAADGLTAIDLSALQTVTGNFEVDGITVPVLSVPALVTIGGGLAIYVGDTLTSFRAPLLASIGAGTTPADDQINLFVPEAGTTELPALTNVNGLAMSFGGGPGAVFSLGALVNAGAIDVGSGELDAPRLTVAGSLDVHDAGLVSLPALTTLGTILAPGALTFDAEAVAQANVLPALTTITGDLTLTANSDLIVKLHALTTVGNITLTAASPTTLELPALTIAAHIILQTTNLSSPALRLDLTKLATASLINVSSFSVLSTLELPALTQAGTLDVSDLPDLTTIDVPLLTTITSQLDFEECPLLTTLTATALTSVGTFVALTDPDLDTCAMETLAADVGATTVLIGGDGGSDCPR